MASVLSILGDLFIIVVFVWIIAISGVALNEAINTTSDSYKNAATILTSISIAISSLAFIVCLWQFGVFRWIGKRFHNNKTPKKQSSVTDEQGVELGNVGKPKADESENLSEMELKDIT